MADAATAAADEAAPPPTTARSTAVGVSILLLLFLVAFALVFLLSPPLHRRSGGGAGEGEGIQKGPEPVERAVGAGAGLDRRWDALRTWAKLAWLKLRSPAAGLWCDDDARGTSPVKEAAAKGLEMGKRAAEQAAALPRGPRRTQSRRRRRR